MIKECKVKLCIDKRRLKKVLQKAKYLHNRINTKFHIIKCRDTKVSCGKISTATHWNVMRKIQFQMETRSKICSLCHKSSQTRKILFWSRYEFKFNNFWNHHQIFKFEMKWASFMNKFWRLGNSASALTHLRVFVKFTCEKVNKSSSRFWLCCM